MAQGQSNEILGFLASTNQNRRTGLSKQGRGASLHKQRIPRKTGGKNIGFFLGPYMKRRGMPLNHLNPIDPRSSYFDDPILSMPYNDGFLSRFFRRNPFGIDPRDLGRGRSVGCL